jgi:N-acetylneuraminic acid mutarotase
MHSMKFIQPFLLLSFLFTLSLWSASPVPYSGKIDIRGVNYFGEAQFAFSLHDGNGSTHWRNGKQPGETIKVSIRNGRYSVLLGGQGMNSLPPELFLNHDKLYLKVEFDNEDGEGLRHLAPDQLITATPRSLVADLARVSEVAKVAEKVGNGAITRDMLSSEVLAKLDANATASPTAPIIITRDMLPADVLADLNKSSTTSSPITLSMLAPEVTAKLDHNITIGASSITKSMLAQEVLNDLNGSTTVVNPPAVGSIISFPSRESAPAGYSLYQRGTPKELVWEEKAPVSVARYAFDGVEVLGGKIYFAGGKDGSSAKNIAERYDPVTNTWETLAPMLASRNGVATAVLDGKLYAIGGQYLSSVEIYDPTTGVWSAGLSLPSEVKYGTAITVSGQIYLVGGQNAGNNELNQVLSFDSSTNLWSAKANMPTARRGVKLVWFENRIWAIGGNDGSNTNKVESYDLAIDTWQAEASLTTARNWPVVWVANDRIYVGGGNNLNSIEVYDQVNKSWSNAGNFPENKFAADAVVLNNKAYVIAGERSSSIFTSKVFAADLNASVAGIYDLYRKDGNASAGTPMVQAEVADGSVTGSKMADGSVTASKIANKTIGKDQISEQILKYLKPEITTQPQAQTVYADTNASFSVTAEGKYLTYQWKKDGGNLTGETNATLNITDANATQHDGNYSVVVSNDFGSVESGEILVDVNTTWSTDGLVGWWKFDETNGTVAYDSSGNGNDGNLTGGPTWATGKIGGALSFDGVDDYVIMPATTDLDLMKLSISTWVYSTNFDQNGFIFEKTADGNLNSQYNLFIQNSELKFRVKPINSSYSDTKVDQSILSGWSFITSSYNSSKRKLFVNGQLVASNDFNETIATNPNGISLIGAYALNSIGNNYFFNGLIDDVRIYNRALSAEEVQALYNLGQ